MLTVLIAIDHSEESHAAATAASNMFGSQAKYLAINVAHQPQSADTYVWGTVYGFPYPPIVPANPALVDQSDLVEQARAEASNLASESGIVGAEPLGDVGDPVEAIRVAAEAHDVDVVVVGWHERSWFRTLFDGSVSDDLIKVSPVPVLVVPTHDQD